MFPNQPNALEGGGEGGAGPVYDTGVQGGGGGGEGNEEEEQEDQGQDPNAV